MKNKEIRPITYIFWLVKIEPSLSGLLIELRVPAFLLYPSKILGTISSSNNIEFAIRMSTDQTDSPQRCERLISWLTWKPPPPPLLILDRVEIGGQ